MATEKQSKRSQRVEEIFCEAISDRDKLKKDVRAGKATAITLSGICDDIVFLHEEIERLHEEIERLNKAVDSTHSLANIKTIARKALET